MQIRIKNTDRAYKNFFSNFQNLQTDREYEESKDVYVLEFDKLNHHQIRIIRKIKDVLSI